MYEMIAHWEKDGKEGSFKVSSYSVDDCVRTAEETINEFNGEMTDYYFN